MPALRWEGDVAVPAGPRARQTRTSLMEAARQLFAEQGYNATSVADIIERAGVSFGTFYQYFHDRGDVLAAMLTANLQQMFESSDPKWRAVEGRPGLYRVIHNFVDAYATAGNAAGIWEEASIVEPEMADLRRSVGHRMTVAVERELRRASDAGLCRPFTAREAALAATALAAMVDRFCFVSFVFDPPTSPAQVDESARLLTELWASAIGLVEPEQ
jgi:AcrR family transcriptional regulator